jgi:nitrogen-specific signal transduction histidine kinase
LGQVFLNLLINAAQAIPEEAGESSKSHLSHAVRREVVLALAGCS